MIQPAFIFDSPWPAIKQNQEKSVSKSTDLFTMQDLTPGARYARCDTGRPQLAPVRSQTADLMITKK